jgi:hypothetical protein
MSSTLAVGAVLHATLLTGNLGAVADQEAGVAGELVGLLRDHHHGGLLKGEIRPGQVDAPSGGGALGVDVRGLDGVTVLVLDPFQGLVRRLVLGAPGSVQHILR